MYSMAMFPKFLIFVWYTLVPSQFYVTASPNLFAWLQKRSTCWGNFKIPIISNCYYLKSTTSVQKLYTHFIHLGCIRMTMRNRTSIYNTSIERVWKNSCIHIWFLKISLFIKGPNIILLSFLFFQILIKGTWLQKSVVIFSVIIAMISWNKS